MHPQSCHPCTIVNRADHAAGFLKCEYCRRDNRVLQDAGLAIVFFNGNRMSILPTPHQRACVFKQIVELGRALWSRAKTKSSKHFPQHCAPLLEPTYLLCNSTFTPSAPPHYYLMYKPRSTSLPLSLDCMTGVSVLDSAPIRRASKDGALPFSEHIPFHHPPTGVPPSTPSQNVKTPK